MENYEQILKQIQSDDTYQTNLDWGQPRAGHPEGSIRQHIRDLDSNLDLLKPRLSDDEYWKLRILIHTHDTFKPDAQAGVAIINPKSHASLAREFLGNYTDDEELLMTVQYHDEPFAQWRKYRYGGDHSDRLQQLLDTITNWDLFLVFLIVDGCTSGKSTEPLEWFFGEVDGRTKSRLSAEWIDLVVNQER